MSSLRRILASRANGARSQGPATPQGKQRSSRNAINHGLLAKIVVMKDESADAFEDHLSQLVDRLQPLDDVEFGMVEEMAAASWRMRRAWAFETRMLDNAVDADESDKVDRMTAAFTTLANTPALGLIHRYETRLHLMYQRSLHNLLLLRVAGVPNEPSPISEYPAALEAVPLATDNETEF
jgi:hypothetical protein